MWVILGMRLGRHGKMGQNLLTQPDLKNTLPKSEFFDLKQKWVDL